MAEVNFSKQQQQRQQWSQLKLQQQMVEGDDAGDKNDKGTGDAEDQEETIKIDGKDVDIKIAKSALSLHKALADPETAEELVKYLAQKAGLLDKKDDIKPGTDKAVAEGRIHKALKTKLGKDYEKFSDLVGPALDEAIQDYLKEEIGKASRSSAEDRWSNTIDKFTETHEMTEDIEDKMKELMEEAPPNVGRKGFDGAKYLERMWKSALDELGIEAPKPKKSGKLRSSSAEEDDDSLPGVVVRKAPKGLTLDDAIEAAMKGIRLKH